MGKAAANVSPETRAMLDRADAVLGRGLSSIMLEGPKEELNRSANTQPSLLLCSSMLLTLAKAGGLTYEAVAGHSLGEYSALVAAGVLDFETALGLVAKRGEAMSAAAESAPGAMAALLGMDAAAAKDVCAAVSGEGVGTVVMANDNAPGQVVLSGDKPAIDRACVVAKEKGAKRAIPLAVQGAFHSPLMAPARDAMREVLAKASFSVPSCRFIANVTAGPIEDPEEIRARLVEQIVGGVRWRESIEGLAAIGISHFVEVGHGTVLTGLVKKIASGATVLSLQTPDDLPAILQACA